MYNECKAAAQAEQNRDNLDAGREAQDRGDSDAYLDEEDQIDQNTSQGERHITEAMVEEARASQYRAIDFAYGAEAVNIGVETGLFQTRPGRFLRVSFESCLILFYWLQLAD